MIRTRDLLLFIVVVVFLLLAIGGTLLSRLSVDKEIVGTALEIAPREDIGYVAVVEDQKMIDRAERLAEMRQKVAVSKDLALEVKEDVIVEEEVVVPDETEVVVTQTCPAGTSYVGLWNPQGLEFEVSEGARLVYRTNTLDLSLKEVLLQLPVLARPMGNQTYCPQSEVVGIANDGSLIKNNEAGLYGVFGAETLVGYALDGFPIYGKYSGEVDECGGVVEAGQYRYYLSGDRATVIGCFAGFPVRF